MSERQYLKAIRQHWLKLAGTQHPEAALAITWACVKDDYAAGECPKMVARDFHRGHGDAMHGMAATFDKLAGLVS